MTKGFGGARRAFGAACLLLVSMAPAHGQYRQAMPPSYYGLPTPERGEAALRRVMLSSQNDERRGLGLAPLDWDEGLAAEAARYAAQMARTGIFAHSPQASRARVEGENLWMGSRGLYGYDRMVGSFLEERRDFVSGAGLPDISATGRWQDVGHYTQIIWRGTRSVGCALAQGPQDDYLVCRYWPAGNIFGRGPLDSEDAPTRLARR